MPYDKRWKNEKFKTKYEIEKYFMQDNQSELTPNKIANIMRTSILPTAKTVPEDHLVIYDDGNGTKRLYMVTAKRNLGYITLT